LLSGLAIFDIWEGKTLILAIPYINFVSIIFPFIGINTFNYTPSFDVNETYEAEISAASFNYIY